ncbi:MAG: hypothetical protein K2X32_06855 [Phycisphaerales bacterium]|nr:hypothetical protein [Phycisphaerales bacterium]
MPPSTMTRSNFKQFELHPIARAAMQSGSLTEEMAYAASAAMFNTLVDPSFVNVIKHDFYDSNQLFLAGVLQSSGNLEFFANSNYVPHRTNWPSSAGLERDTLFLANALRFEINFGVGPTAAGAAEDFDAQTDAASATAATAPAFRANFYEYAMKRGLVNMKIGNRQVVENIKGLNSFPAGRGISGFGNIAATAAGMAIVSNGVPAVENAWWLTPWHVIAPQQRVSATVQWPAVAALGVTGLDCYIEARIGGLKLSMPQ